MQLQQEMTNLKRSALHAQMNPHFIFNCLNSIQNLILKNDTNSAVRYLSKFAELVRQVLNISIAETVPLSENIKMIRNYLDLEKLRFKDKLVYDLQTDLEINPNEINIPPLIIQPYVENALKHGLLTKKSNGKLTIKYSLKQGCLIVSVKDNGIGFNEMKKKGHNANYKSVGMSITKKRLELWNEAVQGDVVEILPNDNSENGTEVIIKLKIK